MGKKNNFAKVRRIARIPHCYSAIDRQVLGIAKPGRYFARASQMR